MNSLKMNKSKKLTDQEMMEISEKSGVDPDVLKSWYKGKKNIV